MAKVEDVEAWLHTRPYTLWADWLLEDPTGRREAAEWFVKQLKSFKKWKKENR